MNIKKYVDYEVKSIQTSGIEYQTYVEHQSKRSGRPENHNHFIYDLKSYSESSGFQINSDDNIIDIGCRGNVRLLLDLIKSGYDNVYGIDIGYEAESQWNSLPNTLQERLMRYDVHNGIPFNVKFKAITCSHVLEHCFDPETVIKHFKDYLVDDGIIHLQIPISTYEDYINHQPHYAFWTNSQKFYDWLNTLGLEVVFSEDATEVSGRSVSDELSVILKKKMS